LASAPVANGLIPYRALATAKCIARLRIHDRLSAA
jgi:hypothetical protein